MVSVRDPRLTKLSPATVNDVLLDRSIRHAVYIERLKTAQATKIVSMFNSQLLPDLMDQLEIRLRKITERGFDTGPVTTKRLKALIESTNGMVRTNFRNMHNAAKKDLQDIALTEVEFQAAMLTGASPVNLALTMPSSTIVKAAVSKRPFEGKLLRDWFKDLDTVTRASVKSNLTIGISQGETLPAIIKRFRSDSGLAGQTRRHIDSVVRTAVNHVTTQAKEDVYTANSNIVDKIQIVATLDSRTTDICISEDGKTYAVGSGHRPPFHIRCRTTTAPVMKSWEDIGLGHFGLKEPTNAMRASMTGQVPSSLTYSEWLKKQPKSVQDDALGKGRAAYFRKGQFNITRPTVNGRGLTLKQLRVKEGLKN